MEQLTYLWKEGWALNPEIRNNASSGGISSVIYSFIKNGGYMLLSYLNKEIRFELTNSTQKLDNCNLKYVKSNQKQYI